jgi:uncharacterized protein (UPF0276 family)
MRRADLTRALGLGHRPELASELLLAPGSVDFVEVVAEACLAEGRVRREVRALAELWPVVPHGVKLSLGSAEGIERARAERLGALARELDAPVVSEHVALTRAGGRDIGHLTPVPRTRLAVRVVARNVDQARRALPDVPLLLENVASPFTWPEDELDEPTFYAAIAEATGCELLLDVGNLYANAVNEGLDPLAVVRAFPLERVRMMHLAGGVFEHGFYYDTHAHPVPDAVLDVLGEALSRAPDAAILLERDAGFEVGLGALLDELSRASQRRPPRRQGGEGELARAAAPTPARRERERLEGLALDDLVAREAELARLLTSREPPLGALAEAIGRPGLDRARGILQRKRVDDALPLLPRLARHGAEVRAIADAWVTESPRGQNLQAVRDATRIAERAREVPSLADDARHDGLMLRARFRVPEAHDEPVQPRVTPFFGRERLGSGLVVWAVKGPGRAARVHLREQRGALGRAHEPPPKPGERARAAAPLDTPPDAPLDPARQRPSTKRPTPESEP